VPLGWVTFDMWPWLFPGAYPCKVSAGSEEDRKARIVSTLQRAARAAGANLVVITSFDGLDVVTRTGQVLSATAAIRGSGLALRTKTDSGE